MDISQHIVTNKKARKVKAGTLLAKLMQINKVVDITRRCNTTI
jgi:hypothetical protein